MKALVLKKNAQLAYEEVAEPKKSDETSYLIKIIASGICGSDISRAFHGAAYHYPLIMGHEFSGIIQEAFPGSHYKPGDRVAVYPLLPCRHCDACRMGRYNQCRDYSYFGSRIDGGFSEFIYVPEFNLVPVPPHLDIVYAAMTEPCAVALHGVRKLTVSGGETAVVYGAGTIGNLAAQWLRLRGCDRTILIDIKETQLGIAEDMEFTVINSRQTDPVKQIYNITKGKGADLVVEACGLPVTYRQAVQSAGSHKEIVFMGNLNGELRIPEAESSDILRKELTIFGTWNSNILPRGQDDWSTSLRFMDKKILLSPLISHRPALREGAEVFRRIADGNEDFGKVIFHSG